MKNAAGFCFSVFAAVVAFAGSSTPWEIEKDIADGSLWKADPVLLVKKHERHGFRFTSSERTSADSRQDGGVVFFGIAGYETKVVFGGEGVTEIEIGLYNNGGTESVVESALEDGTKVRRRVRNDKSISREEFMKIVAELKEALTPEGAKAPKVTDGELRRKGMVSKEMSWEKSTLAAPLSLSWSYQQDGGKKESFEPGYIKVVVRSAESPAKAKKGSLRAEKKEARGSGKIVDNVQHFPNGDVFIDNVPMVDQGMKGYCAAATCERVLRYYGVQVDEHEIAQAAGTTADGGTSTKAMKDSVAAVGHKYRLAADVRYGDFEKSSQERIAGLTKEVQVYNKTAKKLRKKPITDDMYITHEGNTTMYSPGAVDQAMEPEVLKEMRVNGVGKAKYVSMMKTIREQIGKGIPIFWGVKLGIYPEPEIPQVDGYHMRLIIGYNDKKKEILYSDSWGAGHEMKRMDAGWAWTITRSLLFLRPLAR